MTRIVLASSSPRRKEILSRLRLDCEVRPADVDETLAPGEDAYDAAERLARAKASAIELPDRALAVAADTLVVLDGEALGKPRDREDAARMLRGLSGRRHDVVSGVAVRRGDRVVSGREVTGVTFAALSEDEVARYVASGEPDDKAGAYALQGIAALFVTAVDGSPSNVVGLPVRLFYRLAAEAGVDLLVR